MEINDFEIVWLYVVDSGKWIKKKAEIKTIAENLMEKLGSVEGIIRYFTPEELGKGVDSTRKKAEIRVKNKKIKEVLDLYYESDIDNIDPEYLENLQFFRAKMIGFEIELPNKRVEPIDVRLLFHNSGNFILEFSLKLKNMAITPEIVNEIQLLPRTEDELSLRVPQELFKDYSMINPESIALVQKASKNKEKYVRINFTFHEIVWIYWAVVAYITMQEKIKNSKELYQALRYNVFHFFPILIFQFPEFATIDDLLKEYKPELFSMITQEIYLKPEFLRTDKMDETFDMQNNLSDRNDYAVYFCLESAMLLYSQKSRSAIELIAKKRGISVETQFTLEKLDLLLVLEFLHIQQFILMMYDFLLSRKSISEMDTDDLTYLRSLISKGIEEFHDIKLAIKTITMDRLEKGRQCFKFDNSLSVLESKLEIIDTAVQTIHNTLMEFLNILLAILITIAPMIAFSIGQNYEIAASFITIGVLLGIYFLYKQLYKLWYRKQKF